MAMRVYATGGPTNNGTIEILGNGRFEATGGPTNTGAIVVASGGVLDAPRSTFTNSGTITNNGTIAVSSTGVSSASAGSLTNTGTITNNGAITVLDYGVLDTAQGTFTNNGTITVACGGSVSGTISGNQPQYADCIAPTVTSVTSTDANGTYKAGDVISIQVNFDEAVTVAGTPQLTLKTGTSDAVVNYASGSGTATLTFTYTVRAGDTSTDLDYASMSALTLNGGTLRDAASNNATLTLPTPGAAGSLRANKNLTIDGIAPAAPVVVAPANGAATKNTQPTIGGKAEAYSTVTVVIDGAPGETTPANGAGDWSFTPATPLTDGAHTVRATAADAAGNTGLGSDTNTFVVDTSAPDTTISSGPANPTNSTTAAFAFTGNDGGGSGVAAFACQLDGGGFSTCTSPQIFTGLAEDAHTFRVWATDAAANADNTPATYTRVIDTTPPTATITGNAASPTNANPLAVTVTFSEAVSGFTAADMIVENGTVANFAGSGADYTFEIIPSA